ncbi:MAG: hypothetical protein AB1640_25440 [bacterium]
MHSPRMEEIVQAIGESFLQDRDLMPLLSDIVSIEASDLGATPGRLPGAVERDIHLLIHAVGQAVLSTRKFQSANGNSFLGILGDNAAVETYLSFLRQSSFSSRHNIRIQWAKKERYGVQGGLRDKEQYGQGAAAVDMGINPYQNTSNIYTGTGSSSTSLMAGKRGALHSGPDELYMNGWMARGNGPLPSLPFDRPPGVDDLKRLASRVGRKDHRELRFIVPFGERHISPTREEHARGLRLLDALHAAGIPFSWEEYGSIREQMEHKGVYENGNVKLVTNVFPATFDLVRGRADVIAGVDLAGHYAQAVFLLRIFDAGDGRFQFASYETLRDRRHPGHPWPNIYANRFSDIDLGILRKHRVFPDSVPIDFRQRQMHVSDLLDMDRFMETADAGMIVSGARNFHHWVEGLHDPAFRDDMSQVTLSFLAGGFAERRRIAVTYRTVIADWLERPDTAERDYRLAEAYLEFGHFEKAFFWIRRAIQRSPSKELTHSCRLLVTYLLMMQKLTAAEERPLESILGRVSDPRFRNLYAHAIQILSDMELAAGIPIDRVRVVLPQMATLLKKMGQQIGDVFRLLGQTALDQAERFRSDREEAARQGDLEQMERTKQLEQEALGAVARHAADAISCYEHALKFFPEPGRRTERQQLEFDLYLALIRLVWRLSDSGPRSSRDHFVRQEYYYKLFENDVDIARVYEQNGFNLRAIFFYKRACELIGHLRDLGIPGIVPVTARFKIPELYMDEGWYELARQEYRLLIDRSYLETLCRTGPGDASALYVGAALRKACIGYSLMDAFCRNAVDPLRMTLDPRDPGRTVYAELEGFFFRRFRELIVDRQAGCIYGIVEGTGEKEELSRLPED